jgi:hypothetical protein
MRLNLTVEGLTEQKFATEVMSPHLATFGVYLDKPRCTALGKKKGIVHRGGLDHYQACKNDILRWLKQEHGSDVRFSTMIDLYALPCDFPGFEEANNIPNHIQRVIHLEKLLQEDIGDDRFIPYLHLHEYEALLFSDPTVLSRWYPQKEREVSRLVRLAAEFDSPESIDNDNPPSKRIIHEIPEYSGAKPTAGPELTRIIGLPVLRSKCVHFNDWITKLEQLTSSQKS